MIVVYNCHSLSFFLMVSDKIGMKSSTDKKVYYDCNNVACNMCHTSGIRRSSGAYPITR
jgi:hypothetical protein